MIDALLQAVERLEAALAQSGAFDAVFGIGTDRCGCRCRHGGGWWMCRENGEEPFPSPARLANEMIVAANR